MDITHESIERILKIYMDKLKFSLGLDYRNQDYSVQLVDHLRDHYMITRGETVGLKIQTERFSRAFAKDYFTDPPKIRYPKENYEFRQDLEKMLRLVPRMFNTLASPAIADVLVFNPETKKFKKATNDITFEHKFEREINYTVDYRCTAMHFKSGTIVREFGTSTESAKTKARSKIILLLQDEAIYSRDEDSFNVIEPHEDIIHDIILQCKVLNYDELVQLTNKIETEYML